MPRKLRVEYEGAIYHVMNRGDRREAIFLEDEDRQLFLETLGQACEKTGWQAHAWCLMGNHFHLVLQTPRANLVAGMIGGFWGPTRRGLTGGISCSAICSADATSHWLWMEAAPGI